MLPNPYALLREKCGQSQRGFAAKHHLARQTLVAIEQGVYPTLSDRMIVELGKECHVAGIRAADVLYETYGVRKLSEAYKIWREADRLERSQQLLSMEASRGSKTASPMALLISAFGGLQPFSKALKVPTSTLLHYAKGRQREMPDSIFTALSEVKYPHLLALVEVQNQWFDEMMES